MADAIEPNHGWYRLTPDRVVIGMLAAEGFLLLSERFRWFAFNQHKGWTVLVALATVGLTLLLMLLWFAAALSSVAGSNTVSARCCCWSWPSRWRLAASE